MSDQEQPAPTDQEIEAQWRQDCETWRGAVLTGKYAHYCYEWDGLPIDETCLEWPCGCEKTLGASEEEVAAARARNEEFLQRYREEDHMKVERSNEDQHFRIQVTVQSLTPDGNSLMSANPERVAFVATQAARDAADKLGRDLVEAEELRREKRG